MGSENNKSSTPPTTTCQSPSGKRSRDLEDDVYVDNLHSHKRYLSEMMASSLNCLTVGDSIPEHILDSPVRSDTMFYMRDELSLQYSPMSEDLDDSRYYETPMSACSSQSESRPSSPVSPYRYKPIGTFCSSPPSTSQSSIPPSCPPQSRPRGSDNTEGRFPSSPSDICHSGDLRKAALLRSVQMRAHPSCSLAYDLGFTPGLQNIEVDTRPCSFLKPMEDEHEYQTEDCPVMPSSEPEFDQVKDSVGMNIGDEERELD